MSLTLLGPRLESGNIFNLCNGVNGIGCAVKVTQAGLQ